LCALSSWNKVTLLWVPGHCGILGNEEAHALDTQGSSSPFLSPEPAISTSPCVGKHKVKDWLKERHSKHCAATPSMRKSKLFTGMPSDKPSRDLMALDRKQCKLVTGLETSHFTYLGPLSKHQVQEMWTRGIPVPYTVSLPSIIWPCIRDFWLCITRADRYSEAVNQVSSSSSSAVQAP
jgi:hypothetical protein